MKTAGLLAWAAILVVVAACGTETSQDNNGSSGGSGPRFGLELFPDQVGNSCVEDTISVPVSPTADATIDTLLTAALTKGNASFPDNPCVTNIDTAMQKAQTEASFADTTRRSYAILLTD